MNILPNIKLIKDNIFYCEINIDDIKENRKFQKFDSKFPSITRMYNLICCKKISICDIIRTIKKCGEKIHSVKVNDIYNKGINDNENAILFEVCFWANDRTLRTEDIENLESKILRNLKLSYGIKIKGEKN